MAQPSPTISSTFTPLLPKTCGLFDTGIAGDDTSFLTSPQTDALKVASTEAVTKTVSLSSGLFDVTDEAPLGDAIVDTDWLNMMEPLGDLPTEDTLGDSSLDAFVNLETFLMGDPTLSVNDESETLDVKPVICFDQDQLPCENNAANIATSKVRPRKRKLANSTSQAAITTSLFKIPESAQDESLAQDHDYTPKKLKVNKSNKSKLSIQIDEPSTSFTETAPSGDKATIRRLKNNVASKRSREQRKQKFVQLDEEADELEIRNEALRKQISELEVLAKEMKAALVAKMAGK